MKKGFFVALLMVAVMVMALPVSAKAPIIQDLPDIIIGDTGDIEGSGTTALRLFRYLNIFNLGSSDVIERRNAYGPEKLHVFYYQDAADPAQIEASNATAFVPSLTLAEYTALTTVDNTTPPAGKEITAGTFPWLSLMNRSIESGSPANAYAATAAANGLAEGAFPANSEGVANPVEITLVAFDGDFPTTASLNGQKMLTVYTLMGEDDGTSGGFNVWDTYTFDGGAPGKWWPKPTAGEDFGFNGLTTAFDTSNGAIGWNCTTVPASGAGVGTWFLGEDGSQPKFVIPGDQTTADGKVWRCKATLRTDQTTRAASPSFRLIAQMYKVVHWSGISVTTTGDEGAIDAPIVGEPLDVQIHWAVPYDLQGMRDGEKMATSNFGTDAAKGSDNRNYFIMFDGIDLAGDNGFIYMDTVEIGFFNRPADKATPNVKWGGTGGIAFNDASNGFLTGGTDNFGLPLDYGTATVNPGSLSLTMGTIAAGRMKYNKAFQPLTLLTTAHKTALAEAPNDLVRMRIKSTSANPNGCPVVRYQTLPVQNVSTTPSDTTVWYDIFGTGGELTASSVAGPEYVGVPRATTGSWVDCYRYTHRTSGDRYLHFNWDAYGAAAFATNGYAQASSDLTVTELVIDMGLTNP